MRRASANPRSSSAGLSRPLRVVLMAGSGLLLFLLLYLLGVVERLELLTYDLRFRARGERPADAPIVIVAIDDESFAALDQNVRTWPRAEYARLIDAIAAGSPAVIGVDVAWASPGTDAGGDEVLARSLELANPVILAGLIEVREQRPQTTTLQSQEPTTEPQVSEIAGSSQKYVGPVKTLAEAAAGVGVTNLVRQADGVIRRATLRYDLFHEEGDPAFGYALAQAYERLPATMDDGGTPAIWINFRGGPGIFRTDSMYDVLNGNVPASDFEGQIVLIGFTTVTEQDLHITPFDPRGLTPGVEVHANVVATLLNGDAIHRVPAWLSAGLGLVAAVLTALAFRRLRPIHAAAAVGAGVLIYEAVTFVLFARTDLWLPAVSPVILASLTTVGGLAERVLVEEREKRRIRDRFQSFMAPERMAAVLNRWEEMVAEDRPEVVATVLFSDIRGFTSATETLTREGRSGDVIRFLNRYTDAMVEVIFAEQGVLDKILGDGLLVLFGAPEPSPDHALQAVRAALRMRALMPDMNAIWPLRDRRPLRIGIGIHSGPLMDGIVGRGRRVEYTVIGDAVNTASRVEDYTKEVLTRHIKQFGDDGQPSATILISEATYEQVRGRVRVDADVLALQAKGKAQPIRVYRVLGLMEGGEEES